MQLKPCSPQKSCSISTCSGLAAVLVLGNWHAHSWHLSPGTPLSPPPMSPSISTVCFPFSRRLSLFCLMTFFLWNLNPRLGSFGPLVPCVLLHLPPNVSGPGSWAAFQMSVSSGLCCTLGVAGSYGPSSASAALLVLFWDSHPFPAVPPCCFPWCLQVFPPLCCPSVRASFWFCILCCDVVTGSVSLISVLSSQSACHIGPGEPLIKRIMIRLC